MSLRSLRVFLVTAAAVGGLGLAGAAFADDDGPPPDYSAPPVLSPVQLDMQAIQGPLQDLVGLSEPGAVVTAALVPDDDPSQVLVTISDPSGEQREALMDALRLVREGRLTMHDLTPETSPTS